MELNQSGATTTPAPAASQEPTTAAPAQVPQEAAAEQQETVTVGSLIADKNAAQQDKAGSGTPAEEAKPKEEKPDAQAEPKKDSKASEQQPPQSQKDIDRAFGKRLEAERRKWERDHADEIRLGRLVLEANAGKSKEDILAELETKRTEALGITPGLANLLKQHGMLDHDITPKPVEYSEEEKQEIAERWGAEVDEIVKIDPDFNFEQFMSSQDQTTVDRLMSGDMSLKQLFITNNFDRLLKKARDDGFAEGQRQTVENIRNRNANVPAPQAPSAPADTRIDWSNMSSEEFQARQAEIKRAIAQGKRVTMG